VHSNADPKNYLNVFKFQGPPVGTGTLTIKAMVKFGLAFPNPTGMFWWPNNAHITLKEQAPTITQAWYEGLVGESCITVCTKQNLGCDLATMKAQGNSPAILTQVGMFTNCTGPLMPGCSSASPSVGTAGCFYHSDSCLQPPSEPVWTRNDPCQNLSAFSASTSYCGGSATPSCCFVNGQKWCCAYGTGGAVPGSPDVLFGPWGFLQAGAGPRGNCTPVGGYPAGQGSVTMPVRTDPGANVITCEATKNNVADGQRICACSSTGQRVAINNSASRAVLPVAVLLLSLIASF